MAQGDKFAMSLRLMRCRNLYALRPATSFPHPRRALPDAADWGPARSSLVEGAEPSRIRPVFPGCQRDQLGRWWVTFASRCWRSIAGTLSPAAMSAPRLSPGQLYRLLLMALQLAPASTLYRYPPVVRRVFRQLPSGLMETIRRPLQIVPPATRQ